MRTQLIAAAPAHIPHIAAHMREADREEVWASSQVMAAEALDISLRASSHAWTALFEDEPVCMFGASPWEGGVAAAPWLLGTTVMDQYPASVGRFSVWGLQQMLAVYPVLMNWSDARHTQAHTWLRWLGFTLGEPELHGVLSMPFRPFWMGEEGHA